MLAYRSIPDVSKSAAKWERFRTDPCRRRARAPSTPAISTQIFISIVPVAGLDPSLEKRIPVTSNIGGVHSLEAPGFNPPYRRIEKRLRSHRELAHGL
jgi:hypothetical protein